MALPRRYQVEAPPEVALSTIKRFPTRGRGDSSAAHERGEGTRASSLRPTRYYVEVLGKGLDILDLLRNSRAGLRLTDIAGGTGLDVSTAFRLLRTLESRGYVVRDPGTRLFRHGLGLRSHRIGYAQLSGDQPFSRRVTQGLTEAAEKAGVELVVADNRGSPDEAVKSAAWLISQHVDFVIEYEFHYN